MRGFAPRRENDFAGLGAPHPDMRDRELIWGFARDFVNKLNKK